MSVSLHVSQYYDKLESVICELSLGLSTQDPMYEQHLNSEGAWAYEGKIEDNQLSLENQYILL